MIHDYCTRPGYRRLGRIQKMRNCITKVVSEMRHKKIYLILSWDKWVSKADPH